MKLAAVLILSTLISTCGPVESASESSGLSGFETRSIQVGPQDLAVAFASTFEDRAQGLMDVDDLGALDGMLFDYSRETSARFWMKNTLIPLDIAFFDGDGVLLESLTMSTCPEGDCPLYGIDVPFRWALETAAGEFDFQPGDQLVVGP